MPDTKMPDYYFSHLSPLTSHLSPLTLLQVSRLTPFVSRLTTHVLFTSYESLINTIFTPGKNPLI